MLLSRMQVAWNSWRIAIVSKLIMQADGKDVKLGINT
jgi:hypothetical protein